MPIGKEVAERRTRRVEPRGAATGASGLIKPLIVYALLSLIAAWRHLYASARLHERSCLAHYQHTDPRDPRATSGQPTMSGQDAFGAIQ
jgi:hypothetical protein